jgi:uncharacterized membrane protein SirB2
VRVGSASNAARIWRLIINLGTFHYTLARVCIHLQLLDYSSIRPRTQRQPAHCEILDMTYLTIKYLHITCAILSISGFILRGIWMIRQSPYLQHKLTKRLPHLVDTFLLLLGVTMVIISGQYPLQQNWLTAKIIALLIYIALGLIAFRFAKTNRAKITAWLLAIVVFGYMVMVALKKSVL